MLQKIHAALIKDCSEVVTTVALAAFVLAIWGTAFPLTLVATFS